jgi:hypothetical protein
VTDQPAAATRTEAEPCVECALDVPLSKAHTMSIWAELQLRADNPCSEPFECGVHTTLYDPGVCADCDFVRKKRADQAVLDAMAAVGLGDLRGRCKGNYPLRRACEAELARRGLKP